MRTWDSQQEAWQHLPVDDTGYVEPSFLGRMSDAEVRTWAWTFAQCRYLGWRNAGGYWRAHMGLDVKHGRVLDFGCGYGIEALQYAKAGNAVSVADINQGSLDAASRVLRVNGFTPEGAYLVRPPGVLTGVPDGSFDLVVMNGVLHHIEDPVPSVAEAHRVLRDGGEFRVMVYTDIGWRLATGTEPPEDVTWHPQRDRFVRWGDEVGDWADWYNAERLEKRFGHLFRLCEWHYIGYAADGLAPGMGRYGIGILEKR